MPDTHPAEPDLQTLKQRIIDSGALGRSPVYAKLLDYLLDCARSGRQPKEFEIAVDVLGRDSSFDVTRDSVVRVYVHQLRKRLETYYASHDPDAAFRLVIPKGQYIVTLEACAQDGSAALPVAPDRQRLPWVPILLVLTVILLAGNTWQWWSASRPAPSDPLSRTTACKPIFATWT